MLSRQIPQLAPESQVFYETWIDKQYGQQSNQLQMLNQIIDLDQQLLDFVAPAYADKGAPARDVVRLLRALLLLFVKGLRSDNFLVHDELKNHVLSRWFVGLEHDEVITDSFRIALLRLRQRLAQQLGIEKWHDFLKQTVTLAQRQYQPPSCPATDAPDYSLEQHPGDQASSPSVGAPSQVAPKPDPAKATFDLTTVKARARILEGRDIPKRKAHSTGDQQKPEQKPEASQNEPKKSSPIQPITGPDPERKIELPGPKIELPAKEQKGAPAPQKKKKELPRSAGDKDAYWITKQRRGPGKVREVTLGYETGYFATQVGGLITQVVVRQASQTNKQEFNNWTEGYVKAWQIEPGKLKLSADSEFYRGETLRRGEQEQWQLFIPPTFSHPPKGKLDQRYFTYFPEEDLFVCHEGVELRRMGRDKKKQRTTYRAPREACDHCPSANLCKSGKTPRKVNRSDFAAEFARAIARTQLPEYREARRAQRVNGEGSFAHSNCLHGLDHARYYGQPQMLLQSYWTAFAMNLKKACRWLLARQSAKT